MLLKNAWTKITAWLQSRTNRALPDINADLDDQGLLSPVDEQKKPDREQETTNNKVIVKPIPEKTTSLEKQQESFNQLIQQLQGINTHLDRQISQHAELMSRIDELPKLLGSFPEALENQSRTIAELLEQLKTAALKNHQFVDAVERIPAETAKQTDTLENINHQLGAAAEADVAMGESFNRFYDTLEKLEQTAAGQTDGIMQMSKTFAASDRYLKYLVSRQNKRFVWIFITAIGVCVLAILTLAVIIAMIIK